MHLKITSKYVNLGVRRNTGVLCLLERSSLQADSSLFEKISEKTKRRTTHPTIMSLSFQLLKHQSKKAGNAKIVL